MAIPNANHPIPYTSKMQTAMELGQTIALKGKVLDGAKSLEINLLKGHSDLPAATALLHVNLRFEEGKFVFNSYENQVWGKEERQSLNIKPGADYEIRIRALENFFEIRCNGEKIHEFKYRIPFNTAEYFQVKGECTLTGVHWGGRMYNTPWETGFANSGSLEAGQHINIYAIPKGDRFNVDLIARNGDILFHWNPRLGEKAIVRNSCKNKVWEKEEREGPMPFKKDKGCDITIVNEPFSIQIMVDGHQIGTFQHRTANPGQDYIGMRVDGEVDVTGVEFSKKE